MRADVITVANRKGGVGKTTTAVNVAAELGGRGRRVLVVDLDSQGHASLGLGAPLGGPGAHAIFRPAPFDTAQAIRSSRMANVDVLPPERDFFIHEAVNDPLRLARALAPLALSYDHIVIDTSPAIDVTMAAAIAASDRLLIPTQLTHLAYDGVARLAKVLLKVATMLNRGLADFAVAPVQVDMRANLHKLVLARLTAEFGASRVFRGIRADIALAEAFGAGVAVRSYRPNSRGAQDYAALTDDILAAWSPAPLKAGSHPPDPPRRAA